MVIYINHIHVIQEAGADPGFEKGGAQGRVFSVTLADFSKGV